MWQLSATASLALSPDQVKVLNSGAFYVNVSDGSDSCFLAVDTSSPGSQSGSWNSGLQPPYILEQFAIEVLKDVASKMGVDSANTVTQEHVIALVAFMFGEGGDINNDDLFNPLNTGLDAPDLVQGQHAGNGVQSFKSFDAGVEATARTIVGSNQNRLAAALIKPNSTAAQFMYALTYYQKYPGNQFWAEASQPPNQDDYFRTRLQLIQQVRSDYQSTAGLILGTPQKEYQLNLTDPSKLQFKVGNANSNDSSLISSVSSSAADCSGGVVSGSIAQVALGLAWPDPPGTSRDPLLPTDAYRLAVQKINPGAYANGADCGSFVGIVMRQSGADPNYPLSGTSTQESYVRNNPSKYDVVDSVSSTAELQPGDILIVNQGTGADAKGHTYIYVGKQSNGYDEASASQDTRMPSLGKAVTSDTRGNYMRARLKG